MVIIDVPTVNVRVGVPVGSFVGRGVLVTLGISSMVTILPATSLPATTRVTLPRHFDKSHDAY